MLKMIFVIRNNDVLNLPLKYLPVEVALEAK
jgi:hypothetical protein